MSRLTGTDAYGLMEAYNAVYAPEELTEEQVWEEVETWVNSLLEEGYDLNEYTWEEMYEAYLEEIPGVPTSMTQRSQPQGTNTRRPISNAPYVSPFARPRNAGTPTTVRGGGSLPTTIRPKIGSLDPNYKSTALSAPAAGQRVAGRVGGGNAGASVQPPVRTNTTPVRTNTTPVRTTTPPARPSIAPAKTAPAPSPSLAAASSALSGTGALAPKPKPQSDVGAMIARSQARQAAQTPKPAATAPARPMGGGRERMLRQSFDPFDAVMGHLLDEGYADTEEAALKIMANMSEEWRQSIVEAVDPDYTGPSQDPLSRLSRTIDRSVKFATGQQGAEVRAKKQGVPGNVYVQQSGPFSTKMVPLKGKDTFISDTEMKRRGQSTKPMGPIGQ